MGSPSWPYWLVSIGLHLGFFSLIFFNWETEVLEYEALRVDIALNQTPVSRSKSTPATDRGDPAPSPDDSLWEVDPLNTDEYEAMGWEKVKPLSTDNKIARFVQLGILPESFHENALDPVFEDLDHLDDLLEPLPDIQSELRWSNSALAATGSPLPNLNSLGIYSNLVMSFEIRLGVNGIIEDIKYQESGNLELDVRLLEYIRGLSFPVNPDGVSYTQSLDIMIILEEGW